MDVDLFRSEHGMNPGAHDTLDQDYALIFYAFTGTHSVYTYSKIFAYFPDVSQ